MQNQDCPLKRKNIKNLNWILEEEVGGLKHVFFIRMTKGRYDPAKITHTIIASEAVNRAKKDNHKEEM